MGEVEFRRLGDLVHNFDARRIPLSSMERAVRPGPFPYYGATGEMDRIDDFLFQGLHLLVAEDGSCETDDGRPYLQLINGQFWVNNHAHVLRATSDVETRYLYYALSTVAIRPYLSGSVQAKLSQANLNRILVPYFSQDSTRVTIAEVLGALDDKIEANRRMCVALEGFASALYERTYSQSAAGDSIRLSDRVEILTGGTPSTSTPAYWNGSIPWVSVVDLSPGPWVTATERTITPEGLSNSAARILPARTVVVSARGTVGRVGLTCGSMAINQSCYGLRDVNGYQLYLFHLVRTLVPMLQAGAHGSVFDTITRRSLESVSVRQIADQDVAGFEREVTPIYDLMLARARESESLRRLRDALLPKLLSGQVRVRLSKARVNETDRET